MGVRHRLQVAIGRAEYFALTRGVARALGFRTDHITVDGVRVPFLVRGWGPPVFLVHGFGGDKESWLLLARHMRGRVSIVIPDLPGFGAAGGIPPERASARAQSDVLERLVDHLGFGRVHLVGNSMGGGIAIRFAHDHPQRTSSITLIGSVGPVVEKSELLYALDRGENPLILRDVHGLDDLLRFVAERLPPMSPTMRAYLGKDRYLRAEGQEGLFRGWSDPVDGDGVPPDLESITTPALVIHGARDRVIHAATGRALAERLPNARLELMEGVGHLPQMEAPEPVARWIEELVSAVEARRPSRAA